MLFTVDAGNTNIVFGVFSSSPTPIFTARVATVHDKTSDQYAALISEILRLYKTDPEKITGAIISTVVPALVPTLSAAINLLFGITPAVIGKNISSGLKIKGGIPEAYIGADLICGAVGALEKYPAPIIIFDFGTATTVTAIDKDGVFLGGAIIPGVKISLNALSSTAALLQDIDLDGAEKLEPISLDTALCMKSGILLGSASMMDGMIRSFKSELGGDASVIATGGLAGVIVPHCETENIILDRELLLTGLRAIYQKSGYLN